MEASVCTAIEPDGNAPAADWMVRDDNRGWRRPDAAAALEEARLEGLARTLSPPRFARVLDAYLDDTRTAIDRIMVLAIDRDFASIAKAAHALADASDVFGGRRLQQLARELETAGKGEDLAGVLAVTPQLIDEADAAMAVARHRRGDVLAA